MSIFLKVGKFIYCGFIILGLFSLSGCGQTGPLYLPTTPDNTQQTQNH